MSIMKIFIFVLITSALVIKCSTTSTIRYGSDHNEKETRDPSVRFTSVNDSMIVDLNLDLKDPSDLPDLEPEIDISKVLNQEKEYYDKTNPIPEYSTVKEKMLMEIIKYLDTPYKYGGTDKNGIDCSAFTQLLYKDVLSVNLERSARMQFTQGELINEKTDLQFGDLVFFNTRRRVKPGHVGIYIGENLFAHASSSKGVTISSLDYDYYSSRYMGAKRIDLKLGTEIH